MYSGRRSFSWEMYYPPKKLSFRCNVGFYQRYIKMIVEFYKISYTQCILGKLLWWATFSTRILLVRNNLYNLHFYEKSVHLATKFIQFNKYVEKPQRESNKKITRLFKLKRENLRDYFEIASVGSYLYLLVENMICFQLCEANPQWGVQICRSLHVFHLEERKTHALGLAHSETYKVS